jgi:hypothetical protein
MTAEHQLDLVRRYPALYRLADDPPSPSSRGFAREGFAVCDGWFAIIDRLSAKLTADPALYAVQVKEKYGVLAFYLDVAEGLRPDRPSGRRPSRGHLTAPAGGLPLLSLHFSPEMSDELDAAVAEAREESSRTCEVCGEPGRMTESDTGWLAVRCDPCGALDDVKKACWRLEDVAATARGKIDPRVRARSRRKSASAIFAADAGAVDAAVLALRRKRYQGKLTEEEIARWFGNGPQTPVPKLLYSALWQQHPERMTLPRDERCVIESVLVYGTARQKAWVCEHYGRAEIVWYVRRQYGTFLRSREQVLEWVSRSTMYRWERWFPELREWWAQHGPRGEILPLKKQRRPR